MGGSAWSDSHYENVKKLKADAGIPLFAYNAAVKSGRATGIHPTLDPKGVKVRESRDSATHPIAVPVAILLDTTGSMSFVPGIMQNNLKQLMGLLLHKGYLEHPAIMVGAINDCRAGSRAPLQVGQFESGIEIDENLTNLYLESGGGGSIEESYELALYFLARHTIHDHWEKRGQLGYVFIIGDETPYPTIRAKDVEQFLGHSIQEDLPVEQIVEEVKERYHIFYILPKETYHYSNPAIHKRWAQLVGQNIIKLEDLNSICETMAAQIGLYEEKADADRIKKDLIDAGSSSTIAHAVTNALVPVESGGGKKSSLTMQAIPDSEAPKGVTEF